VIREIQPADHALMKELLNVITASVLTVAREFNLTEENAPSNPAFLTYGALEDSMRNGLAMYGYFDGSTLAGCVGIEASRKEPGAFYIERLAVLPEQRHRGLGRKLLDCACSEIRRRGGSAAAIGIINENTVLKEWYRDYGFSEVAIRRFARLPFDVCFMEKRLNNKNDLMTGEDQRSMNGGSR